MKRILFVDDEASLLDGLRNALRKQKHEWDMVFACGGDVGLEEIKKAHFDVVISDMRMPRIDGLALLTKVKELQPHAVRIVLSGQTDADSAMRVVFVAHQVLSKPCDVETFRSAISRALALHDLLTSDALKRLAGDVSMLPPAPGIYLKLNEILANADYSVKDASAVVERDVGLTAKILQVVNSAFFGLPRKVNSVSEATNLLGANTLKNLALALEVFGKLPASVSVMLKQVQNHSLLVAKLARKLMGADRAKADLAFVAGILHDVGRLVGALREANSQEEIDRSQHPVLGAYLLGLWGLPHVVVEAVAFHEDPWKVEHTGFEVMDALYVADRVATVVAQSENSDSVTMALPDFKYLSDRGVSFEQVAALQEEARTIMAAAGAQ